MRHSSFLEPIVRHVMQIYVEIFLVEDELILALPMFPMHEKKDCSLSQNQAYYATSDIEQKNTYKPFAGLNQLAELKEKKSGSSTN